MLLEEFGSKMTYFGQLEINWLDKEILRKFQRNQPYDIHLNVMHKPKVCCYYDSYASNKCAIYNCGVEFLI